MKILIAAVVLLAAVPAYAHHSFAAEFDSTACRDFTGTLTKIDWQNPHGYFYMDVKDANGELQVWALEATSRNGLQRIGVTFDYVKPGDTVKARCHRLRDGSNGCLLGFLKARDGTVKDWDGNNAPPPPDF